MGEWFCGHVQRKDMFRRQWMAQSVVTVAFPTDVTKPFYSSSLVISGNCILSAHSELGRVAQRLQLSMLLQLYRGRAGTCPQDEFHGYPMGKDITVSVRT